MDVKPVKKHKTAGCFLLRDRSGITEVLLIYKKWPGRTEGWLPPKGHIEHGESRRQTALRETTEETGYSDIKILSFIKTARFRYDWDDGFIHDKTVYWYAARILSDTNRGLQLTPAEQQNTFGQEWFEVHEALKKLLFDDEREALQELIKRLGL
jgi:8-oxo-dGTP pyrophosphatase MutT (NUDIX family)